MPKIFITGGHLTPALAVIDSLSEKDWNIFYIGRKHSLEGEKALSAEFNSLGNLKNLKFLSITTGRLQRRLSLQTIPSLLKIPVGLIQSLYWLVKYSPDVVLSFGGYVGVPVAIMAWLLGIPIITHEQTIVPSLSSKLIAPLAKKILVSWPQMVDKYQGKDVVLTGNPIRKEVFEINQTDQSKDFQIIKRQTNLPTLYITGGSQGAHSINKIFLEALPKLLPDFLIIHPCGTSQKSNDYENLSNTIKSLPQDLQQRYFLQKFIDGKNIGWVLNQADIIIGRSGANTVSEIAALGKVAILIPLPWSGGGEQQKNAELLEQFQGAKILPQASLTSESLISTISEVRKNQSIFKAGAQKAKQLIIPNASQNIVFELEKVLS